MDFHESYRCVNAFNADKNTTFENLKLNSKPYETKINLINDIIKIN